MQPLTAQEIIARFELQVNDLTELSTQEELNLLNEIYQDICSERPWRFLVTPATGALAYDGATGLWYITVPEDFSMFSENYGWTENNTSNDIDQMQVVVFVGVSRSVYRMVNYADREQYVGNGSVCYHDQNTGRIWFPVAPQDTSLYAFDYIRVPEDLELDDSPIFPARFHTMFQYAMAVDDFILQLSPKANTFLPANNAKFEKKKSSMEFWDASQLMN